MYSRLLAIVLAVHCGSASAGAAGDSQAVTPDPGDRIPECGVASAYCVLHMLRRPVELDDLKDRFHALYPEADLAALSMAQIARVLESYDLHTAAVRADRDEVRGLQTPAILFFAAPGWRERGQIGHFLVLRAADADGIHVVDLSYPEKIPSGTATIKHRNLHKAWDGEALVVSAEPPATGLSWRSSAPALTAVVLAVVLGAVIAGPYLRRPGGAARTAAPGTGGSA